MTQDEIQSSAILGQVTISLLTRDSTFKDLFKTAAPTMAADIESASTNPTCSCRGRVLSYIGSNVESVSALIYEYGVSNNLQSNIKDLFENTIPPIGPTASGRVAKTTIKDWPEFAKGIQKANLSFTHMSTSIVGEDVYVFFL